MRHRLVAAFAAALFIAATCATAPAAEQNTPPRHLTPRGSVQLQLAPSARPPETTGALPMTQGPVETAKAESEARRVTNSVGRTLERMEEMFRTAVP
jgi:hypothetical protein